MPTGLRIMNEEVTLCEWNSCVGACDNTIGHSRRECQCDQLCVHLGDCCLDYEDHCTEEGNKDQWVMKPPENVIHKHDRIRRRLSKRYGQLNDSPLFARIQYVSIPLYYPSPAGVNMSQKAHFKCLAIISKCPQGYNGVAKDLCEDQHTTMPFVDTPVCTSRLLYKNKYCAQCASEKGIDNLAFQIELACPDSFLKSQSDYESGEISDETLLSVASKECQRAFVVPEYCSATVKRLECRGDGHPPCVNPKGAISPRMNQMCQVYSDPVIYASPYGDVLMKNQICAICDATLVGMPECYSAGYNRAIKLTHTIAFHARFSVVLDIDKTMVVKNRFSVQNYSPPPIIMLLLTLAKCSHVHNQTDNVSEPYLWFTGSLQETGALYPEEIINNTMSQVFHPVSTRKDIENMARNLASQFRQHPHGPCEVWITNNDPILSTTGCLTTLVPCTNDNIMHLLIPKSAVFLRLRNSYIYNGSGEQWLVYQRICRDYPHNDTFSLLQGCIAVAATPLPQTTRSGLIVEGVLTTVGNLISLTCLTGTLITYSIFSALRNTPGKILMCLVCSLLVAQSTFHASFYLNHLSTVCWLISAVQHYAWMAAFTWTNILCFDLCKTGRHLSEMNQSRWKFDFLAYSVYGWSVPGTVLGAALFFSHQSNYLYVREQSCWISANILLYFFIIPVASKIFFNVMAFAYFVYKIHTFQCDIDNLCSLNTKKVELLMYVKLFSVMGFTWVFGFLANIKAFLWMIYPFALFNSLQGIALFVVFAMSKRARKFWAHCLFGTDNSATTNVVHIRETAN